MHAQPAAPLPSSSSSDPAAPSSVSLDFDESGTNGGNDGDDDGTPAVSSNWRSRLPARAVAGANDSMLRRFSPCSARAADAYHDATTGSSSSSSSSYSSSSSSLPGLVPPAKLGGFPEAVARFYAANAVLALEQLHRRGVAHRDLNPDTLLLGQDGYLKVSGLGRAKRLPFMAPLNEVLPSDDERLMQFGANAGRGADRADAAELAALAALAKKNRKERRNNAKKRKTTLNSKKKADSTTMAKARAAKRKEEGEEEWDAEYFVDEEAKDADADAAETSRKNNDDDNDDDDEDAENEDDVDEDDAAFSGG